MRGNGKVYIPQNLRAAVGDIELAQLDIRLPHRFMFRFMFATEINGNHLLVILHFVHRPFTKDAALV